MAGTPPSAPAPAPAAPTVGLLEGSAIAAGSTFVGAWYLTGDPKTAGFLAGLVFFADLGYNGYQSAKALLGK